MRLVKLGGLVVLLLVMVGCTHKISIKPIQFDQAEAEGQINGACGICISSSQLAEVVTEGGSDKYQYAPYDDFRFGIASTLRSRCERVYFCEDKEAAMARGFKAIIVPTIKTASEGGFWFWPPQTFTFSLDADVFDGAGGLIQHISTTGHGAAGRAEWKENLGYAGSRAMEETLRDFAQELDYDTINKCMQPAESAE